MNGSQLPAMLCFPGADLDYDDSRLVRLMQAGPMTRGELANRTGWARNTVVSKVEKLMAIGILRQSDGVQAERGRPSLRFEIVSTATLFFVVIFQEDLILAAICNLLGEALVAERRVIGGNFGPDDAVSAVTEMLEGLTSQGIERKKIGLCVIGVQGPVSQDSGTIPWSRVGVLPKDMSDILGMKVIVENDANLNAIGVHHLRGDVDDLLVILVAKGIGAGIIVNGKLHRGVGGWAGEVGHVPIAAGGDTPCICGGRGCAATLASNTGLIAAVSTPERPVASMEELHALGSEGDLETIFALRQAGRHIGEAVLGLTLGLSPQLVMVGGQAAQIGDHMVAGVRELLSQKTPAAVSSMIRVESAPDHLVMQMLGASKLGFERLFPEM